MPRSLGKTGPRINYGNQLALPMYEACRKSGVPLSGLRTRIYLMGQDPQMAFDDMLEKRRKFKFTRTGNKIGPGPYVSWQPKLSQRGILTQKTASHATKDIVAYAPTTDSGSGREV